MNPELTGNYGIRNNMILDITLAIDTDALQKQRKSLDKALLRMYQNDWPESEDISCLRAIIDVISNTIEQQKGE